ncbi:ABC transporter permease [Deferribacter abyssi]|uniref:ABC transporter permease n=1 Tax=Deferribacter abyssi TaxID=213806 RepID=UPI003C2571EE
MSLIEIIFRMWTKQKTRLLFLIFAVVIPASIIITLYWIINIVKDDIETYIENTGVDIVVKPQEDITLNYNGYSLAGDNGKIKYFSLESVKKVNDSKYKSKFLAVLPELTFNLVYNGKVIKIYGIQLDNITKMRLSLSGRLPMSIEEVVVGNNIASEQFINVGKKILLGGEEFLVSGILNPYGNTYDNAIIMDLKKANLLLNRYSSINKILIKMPYSAFEKGIYNEVIDELKSLFGKNFDVFLVNDDNIIKLNSIRNVIFFLHLVSVIIIIFSLLSISNYMMNSVKLRTKEIGILRSIGYKSRHIICLILVEIIFICVLGVVISFGLSSLLTFVIVKYFVGANFRFVFDIKEIMFFMLGIFSVSMISGLLPAKKAAETDPVNALNFF